MDERPIKPSTTPESEENLLISMAYNLAKEKIMNGTASSQLITHFLKLGSSRDRLEKEMLEKQKALLEAKTESLKSSSRMEELYYEALSAMKAYMGND